MSRAIPRKIEVEVTARRVSGMLRPNGDTIVGACDLITYDIQAIEDDVSYAQSNVTPQKRPVSTIGLQVDIEAARVGDIGYVRMFSASDIRFFIPESVVWANCTGNGV